MAKKQLLLELSALEDLLALRLKRAASHSQSSRSSQADPLEVLPSAASAETDPEGPNAVPAAKNDPYQLAVEETAAEPLADSRTEDPGKPQPRATMVMTPIGLLKSMPSKPRSPGKAVVDDGAKQPMSLVGLELKDIFMAAKKYYNFICRLVLCLRYGQHGDLTPRD